MARVTSKKLSLASKSVMVLVALKQTRQPFQGLAVVVRTPGQFVRLTRLGTFPSVSVSTPRLGPIP